MQPSTAFDQCEAQTVGLSVQDFFDQTKQKVTARIASYQLDIVVRPIGQAGGVLTSLSSVVGDALQIRGINLTIEDPEPLKSEARRLAINDAKKRAAELADEIDVQLGSIISVHDENPGTPRFVQSARTALMAGQASAANIPFEAGSVSASSAVTLIYAIAG